MPHISWPTIEAALGTLQPVTGGFTRVQRGIVTLPDGQRVFVKIAVDALTQGWINKELKVYHWLAAHGYKHAPQLVAKAPNGFALPDLSGWDWSDNWTTAKLDSLLAALDDLAALSPQAANDFTSDFEDNPWPTVPTSMTSYTWLQPPAKELQKLQAIIQDEPLRQLCHQLSETKPWQGNQLVHYDVRHDNFAFNPQTGQGLLVDWNWTSLGNEAFDKTGLLVSVCKSGFTEFNNYKHHLDKASLAYVLGFWLKYAAITPNDGRETRLRLHQITSALVAHDLLQDIIRG